MQKGIFITLEGIEGAGKSTVLKYAADYLKKNQVDLIVTREPGGTEIAEKIRKILLDHHREDMHADTEMLLYFAGRAQHLQRVILPALNQGKWVLCDRFTSATYAYQGGGRGISMEKIAILEQWVQGDLRPDCVLLLDVDVEIGMQRIQRNRILDRFEVEEHAFFAQVRECYLHMARKDPARYKIIDANLSLDKVNYQVKNVLSDLMKKL